MCIFKSVFLESVCFSNNPNWLVQVQAGRRLLLFPTVDTAKPHTNLRKEQKYLSKLKKVYFFQLQIVFVSFSQQRILQRSKPIWESPKNLDRSQSFSILRLWGP